MSDVRRLSWVFFLISLLLYSCIPDPLEVDGIPVIKPQIVVSSQIIPDQSLIVMVTRTFGALDASDDSDPGLLLEQIAVNDAVVTLAYGSQIDSLLFLGSGVYGGVNIDLNPGQEYTLRVKSNELGEVTATTEVKPRINFRQVAAELYFDGYDDTLAQVSYSLRDPPGKNWYMINVLEIDSNELLDNVLNPRDFTRLLDDQNFDDRLYTEVFRVFPREFSKGDTIAVYLSNISEEYYRYMDMRLNNRFGFFEFISEPVNYPSNVKGGRGFFNLYIPDIHLITLE